MPPNDLTTFDPVEELRKLLVSRVRGRGLTLPSVSLDRPEIGRTINLPPGVFASGRVRGPTGGDPSADADLLFGIPRLFGIGGSLGVSPGDRGLALPTEFAFGVPAARTGFSIMATPELVSEIGPEGEPTNRQIRVPLRSLAGGVSTPFGSVRLIPFTLLEAIVEALSGER